MHVSALIVKGVQVFRPVVAILAAMFEFNREMFFVINNMNNCLLGIFFYGILKCLARKLEGGNKQYNGARTDIFLFKHFLTSFSVPCGLFPCKCSRSSLLKFVLLDIMLSQTPSYAEDTEWHSTSCS